MWSEWRDLNPHRHGLRIVRALPSFTSPFLLSPKNFVFRGPRQREAVGPHLNQKKKHRLTAILLFWSEWRDLNPRLTEKSHGRLTRCPLRDTPCFSLPPPRFIRHRRRSAPSPGPSHWSVTFRKPRFQLTTAITKEPGANASDSFMVGVAGLEPTASWSRTVAAEGSNFPYISTVLSTEQMIIIRQIIHQTVFFEIR